MNFSKNLDVGILYPSTKFELNRCTNNRDLSFIIRKNTNKQIHTQRLRLILSPYMIIIWSSKNIILLCQYFEKQSTIELYDRYLKAHRSNLFNRFQWRFASLLNFVQISIAVCIFIEICKVYYCNPTSLLLSSSGYKVVGFRT